MIGRILRIAFFVALFVLIVNRLFSRQRKQGIHDVVRTSAWVLLAASALALGWYMWFAQ
ncbi:protein MIGRI [Neisseria weaveri]|uniref:protein MIGRI n=1 Tax=Neisseria weaveri TaxID=28091 RepID=UPI001900C377|nr:hypothetical protein [Neisseria weaveri]